MIRVGLIGDDVPRFLRRLLPLDSDSVWMGRRFEPLDPSGGQDWVVVLHRALREPIRVVGDPANVAYISMEPREGALVGDGYLEQFSRVAVTAPRVVHPGLVRRAGLGWWVGISVDYRDGHNHRPDVRLTYDDLAGMQAPPLKLQRISIVTSTARFAPGHVARDRLIDEVMRRPIARFVDLYGGGRRPIDDKWDAIAPDAYHLALENGVLKDYWTEKLSDAFLGYALPLYFGCPNLDEYFPQASFIPIDAFRPSRAIRAMEEALDTRPWEARLPAILEARRRVLTEHHPLSVIAAICDRPAATRTSFELHPPSRFAVGPGRRTRWHAARRVYRATRTLRLAGRPLWRTPP